MKIGLDLMGGDNGIQSAIKATHLFLKNYPHINVVLYGDGDLVPADLKMHKQITIVDTKVAIDMDDDAMVVLKSKKDSSISLGAIDLGAKKIDAFVTAGSTAAIVAAGVFLTKRIEGIERPSLASVIPGQTFLTDLGANSDAKAQHLIDQAYIGKVYMSEVKKINNPKIALLNIGSEPKKGSKLYQEVYTKLANDANLNFVGNLESRDLLKNDIDILITDGFSGNLVLKTVEGTFLYMIDSLKKIILQNIATKMAGNILKPGLKVLKNSLNYEEEGGAMLFGINGIMIKAHGSSNAYAIEKAMEKAKIMIEEEFIIKLKKEMPKDRNDTRANN